MMMMVVVLMCVWSSASVAPFLFSHFIGLIYIPIFGFDIQFITHQYHPFPDGVGPEFQINSSLCVGSRIV